MKKLFDAIVGPCQYRHRFSSLRVAPAILEAALRLHFFKIPADRIP
jgi:hypothetical protein